MDEKELEDLFRVRRKELLRYAFALTRDYDEASDITQEALIYLVQQSRGKRQAHVSLTTWLKGGINLFARTLFRLRKYPQNYNERLDDYLDTGDVANPPERVELRLDVHRALIRLSPILSRIATLYYIGNRTIPEIAERVKIPQTTVFRRLKQASQLLRIELAGYRLK